jgi:hypothetical protein
MLAWLKPRPPITGHAWFPAISKWLRRLLTVGYCSPAEPVKVPLLVILPLTWLFPLGRDIRRMADIFPLNLQYPDEPDPRCSYLDLWLHPSPENAATQTHDLLQPMTRLKITQPGITEPIIRERPRLKSTLARDFQR